MGVDNDYEDFLQAEDELYADENDEITREITQDRNDDKDNDIENSDYESWMDDYEEINDDEW